MTDTATKPQTQPTETETPQSQIRPLLTEERIRIRAYELYEKRQGNHPGDAETDWYQAVAELESEANDVVR